MVSLNGQPPMEEVIPTLRVYGNKYGGYDGCNGFSVDSGGGPPFGPAGDAWSVPDHVGTLRGCDSERIGEQADAYVETLKQGVSHRMSGDMLEVLDGAGNVTLVFKKQTVLPGRSADLDGTQWQLLVNGEGDGGVIAPTLAFLSERVAAGSVACGGYVSEYSLSGRRAHFTTVVRAGFSESCGDESRQEDLRYLRDLGRAREYSVHESTGSSLLRVRTVQGRVVTRSELIPQSEFHIITMSEPVSVW